MPFNTSDEPHYSTTDSCHNKQKPKYIIKKKAPNEASQGVIKPHSGHDIKLAGVGNGHIKLGLNPPAMFA